MYGLLLMLIACKPGTDETPGTPTETASPTTTDTDSLPTNTHTVETVDPSECSESSERGLNLTTYGSDWRFAADYHTPSWDLRWGGRGIVVADFDGDGSPDILVPQLHEPSRLLFNDGTGEFSQRSALPVVEGVAGAVGGSAADFDGDGDFDVFLYGQIEHPVLLINDGSGTFAAEQHPEWDGPEMKGCGNSASWADYDLDGDLDLYYGRNGFKRQEPPAYVSCPSRLLVNNGGVLTEEPGALGPRAQELKIMASGWHQFDDDPYPELYLVADAILEGVSAPGIPPVVGSNLLVDNSESGLAELDIPSLELIMAGMGLGAADLNDDGITDVMVSGSRENRVLVSSPTAGAWVDYAGPWGLMPDGSRHQFIAWSGEFHDLDHDGLEDLVVTYGAIPGGEKLQPDEILLQREGEWQSVGAAWGFDDTGPYRGTMTVDLNGDGWLDIVKRELGGVVQVGLATCGTNTWSQLDLVDEASNNRFAIGAQLLAVVGERRMRRSVTAGSTSFASGGPPTVHFGLGEAEQIDELHITWPDGEATVLTDLPSNHRITITR